MTSKKAEKALRIKRRVLISLEIEGLTHLYEEGMTREQAEEAVLATYS